MKKPLIMITLMLLAIMVTAGTWSPNRFFYQPPLNARGTTEKNNFDLGLNRADAHLARHKTLGDPGYENLAAALTTIGSTNISLTIPATTVPITSNTTIPANVDLRVLKGGRLDVANGISLTINGSIEAGPYQIFSWTGTGAINLSGSPTRRCYLQWWGAQSGMTNSVTAPLLKAYQGLTVGQTIQATKGVWRLATSFEYVPAAGWQSALENLLLADLVGDDEGGTILYMDVGAGNDGITIGGIYGGYQKQVWNGHIKNFTILGNTNSCRHALNLRIWNHQSGTEKINLFCGSADAAVRLSQAENGNWEFNLGFGWVKALADGIPYADMRAGVLLEPEPGGYGLGGGTFNRFKIRKTFSSGCVYAFKGDTSSNIFVDAGDIETCVDGEVQSHWNGQYDQSPNYQVKLYNGSTTRLAQTFTLSGTTEIRNLGFLLDKVGSPTGLVAAKIYDTSMGSPDAAVYTSYQTVQASDLNDGLPFNTLYDTGKTSLAAGTYAIEVEFSGGDINNCVCVDVDLAGGGPGTCYTYDGSWHAQTYTMRHVINARASIWLTGCTESQIDAQHLEANWRNYLIDNCTGIRINNSWVGGDIKIARSRNVQLVGNNAFMHILCDPVSTLVLEGNRSPLNSDVLQDYGATYFTGELQDWYGQPPVHSKGNNFSNFFPITRLDRWQVDRPDALGSSWQKDADMTWTWCGDGKVDTTHHPMTSYCAKLVKTSSGWWNAPGFSGSALYPLLGRWVTFWVYVNYPANGQTWSGTDILGISPNCPAWAPSTAYQIGDGMSYGDIICVTPGLSDSGSVPNWAGYNHGDYIVDGTVVWLKWTAVKGTSGGNADATWADGKFRKLTCRRFIPRNCTGFSPSFYWSVSTAKTAYFALPGLTLGVLPPPDSLLSRADEASSSLVVNGKRIWVGLSAAPTDGSWCCQGDEWHRGDATASQKMGGMCVTAGTAGGTAVWKDMPNLAN